MTTETLRPDGEFSDSGLVASDYTDHDEDPDVSSVTIAATGNNVNTEYGVDFPTPTGNPTVGVGLQEFRAGVEEFDSGQGGVPDARIELWENGSLVRAGSDTPIEPYQVLSFTWNANEISTPDGSLVQCKVIGTKSGGSPGNRNAIDIGHIEWNVEYSAGATQINKDLEAQWNIDVLANKDLVVEFDIFNLANKDLDAQFDILNLINKSIQADWSIFNLVNKDLQADWDIAKLVNKDLEAIWDIEGEVGTVSKDLQAIWDITELVNKYLQADWSIFILVNKDIQAVWDMRQLADRSIQGVWDIDVLVYKDIQAKWDLFGVDVSRSVLGLWRIASISRNIRRFR